MKRALFISTRNPFSRRYSGDIIGSKDVIANLKKITDLDGFLIGGASQNPKKFIDIVKKTYN